MTPVPLTKEQALTHYLALDMECRYRRFGLCRTDAQLISWMNGLEPGAHMLVGITGQNGEPPVGVLHLADLGNGALEGGISVLPEHRRSGFGRRLIAMGLACAHALGASRLVLITTRGNQALAGLATACGGYLARSEDGDLTYQIDVLPSPARLEAA